MNTKTKLIIATINLVIQLANLIFLSTTYPEISIIISIISYIVAFAVVGAVAVAVVGAVAVAVVGAVAGAVVGAVAGAVAVTVALIEYLEEKQEKKK
jgi:uncharacterized membrane protein required for colicin V production